MTHEQIGRVDELTAYDFDIVHHGDCLGADADMHRIARANGQYIVGHPPIKNDFRAFCDFDEEHLPKEYLTRDRDIVHDSELLIATPAEMEPQPKGGTWYTVRYAETLKKPIVIVWPDGSLKRINL